MAMNIVQCITELWAGNLSLQLTILDFKHVVGSYCFLHTRKLVCGIQR